MTKTKKVLLFSSKMKGAKLKRLRRMWANGVAFSASLEDIGFKKTLDFRTHK